MIFRFGKSTAMSSTTIGFEYLSRRPPPPRTPAPMPLCPRMEEGGQPGGLDHLVEPVGGRVVREEPLGVRVELEAAECRVPRSAVSLFWPPSAPRAGSIAGERDQHVGIRGGDLGDLLVRDRGGSRDRLAVDARRSPPRASVRGSRPRRPRPSAGARSTEVLCGAGAKLGRKRIEPVRETSAWVWTSIATIAIEVDLGHRAILSLLSVR